MKRFTTLLLLFIGLKLFAQDSTTLVQNGQKVPDFKFETEKNKSAEIKNYRGKVVVINFFATWCGPCRNELPVLHSKVWEKYRNNPNFALFIFGREEGWEKVTAFKETNKFSFPMLPDEGRKIFSLFATEGIPRTLIIDQEGNIVLHEIGYSPERFKEIENKLAALLK